MNGRLAVLLLCLFFTLSFGVLYVILPDPEFTERVTIVPPPVKGYHASMYLYDNPGFFEQSVASFKETEPLPLPPRIFMVNQHVLAAHLIAEQFALAADTRVKTVILITQNNWNAGKAPIITSEYGWKTPLGTLSPASSLIASQQRRN